MFIGYKSIVSSVLPKVLLGVCLTCALPIQAAIADVILPGRCHMGLCWENKLIRKELLRQNSRGKLYAVELASRSWNMDTQPPNRWEAPKTSYVYCSTTRPAFIFNSDGTYLAHLLNPGGSPFGYEMSSYPIYWATCHNFVGPDFFSEEMTARAIRLGYPLSLEIRQVELSNVLDIME